MSYSTHRRPHSHNHVKFQEDDYSSYVSKMERATSKCEGPHFPNLSMMFRQKEAVVGEKEEEEVVRTVTVRPGIFGKATHIEQLKGGVTREVAKTDEEDVDRVAGEYISRKHHGLTTV